MPLTQIAGFAGAALSGAAYIPQIAHMVRERCVAGISRAAFGLWFVASGLILLRAVAVQEAVFIALGALQTTATAFILVYATIYADAYCESHAPRQHTPAVRVGGSARF